MHTSTQSLNWPELTPPSWGSPGISAVCPLSLAPWWLILHSRPPQRYHSGTVENSGHYYNHCFGASTPLSVVLSSSSSCHCLVSLHPQQPLHHHFPLLRPPNTTQAALDRPLHHNTVSTTIQHTWHTYSRHVFHGKDLLSSVPYKCQEVDTVGTVCGEY